MLYHPKTPIVVGSALIATLTWMLSQVSPMPAPISTTHGQIDEMSSPQSCTTCHSEAGLTAGCLSCHGEIASQLASGEGYHHHLTKDGDKECSRCHSEHNGEHFPLINDVSWGAQVAEGFRHPHVAFRLVGKHADLTCAKCHVEQRKEPFTLRGYPSIERRTSYLGIEQRCGFCHVDRHTDGLSGDCGACHGQKAFLPTDPFDHGELFPLEGGHDGLDCTTCHVVPSPAEVTQARPYPFPFDHPRGVSCEGCHETPHRTRFSVACDTCHPGPDPVWTTALERVDHDAHEPTGFGLDGPHAAVACEQCHPRDAEYDERYPNPSAPGYLRKETTCQGCHEDVHRGQFAGRYERCLACHESYRFEPSTFSKTAHARVFKIQGAHLAVACSSCHVVEPQTDARRFVGTGKTCKGCHETPHAGQFQDKIQKGDCTSCHRPESDTFRIEPFDHAKQTGHELYGAHYHRAKCADCHVEVPMKWKGEVRPVRRFAGTPTECGECHADAHRGQFQKEWKKKLCADCHNSHWSFEGVRFDHNKESRFRLEGAHTKVACDRCHVPVTLEDGAQMVQYRPVGRLCKDCHDIPTKDPLGE